MANVVVVSHFITIWFFTYLGVLCRVGVSTISEIIDQNSILKNLGFGFFLPNLIGSLVMGIASGMVDLCKPYQAWYVGITVGFCGCCTTFSAWQKSMSVEFLSGNWVVALIQMFTTYVGSYASYCCGFHGGTALFNAVQGRTNDKNEVRQYQKPKQFSTDTFILLVLNILITVALWCGIFLDHEAYRQRWWVSLALAPVGSFLRFALSKFNPMYPTFPLFTFLVNSVGSALSMSFYVGHYFLTQNHNSALNSYEFWVLNGLTVGSMGSLTTVSTFVKEIYFLGNQKLMYLYRYALVSLIVTQLCCILIGCAIFAKN